VAFGSVPFGLLIKGLQFVSNEREKLNNRLDAIARSVADNRTSIDVLRADTEARRDDLNRQNANLLIQLDQLSDEYHEGYRAIDRRLVIQEARSGLSQKIGELEQSVREINNQLNELFKTKDLHE
jgi:chromosome segregation ATPase